MPEQQKQQQQDAPRKPWGREQSDNAIDKIMKGNHVLIKGLNEGEPCMPKNGINGSIKMGMNSIILLQAAVDMKTRNPNWYSMKNVDQTFQENGKTNHVRKNEESTKTQSFLPLWKEEQNERGFHVAVLDETTGKRIPLINNETGQQASRPIYVPHFNGDQLQQPKGAPDRVDPYQRMVAEKHIAAIMEEPISLTRNIKALTIAALNGCAFKPERTKTAKEALVEAFTLAPNKESFFKTVSTAQHTVLKNIQPDIENQAQALAEAQFQKFQDAQKDTADIER